jgi:hypothetical protein
MADMASITYEFAFSDFPHDAVAVGTSEYRPMADAIHFTHTAASTACDVIYLVRARDGYPRWGADGKVRQLETRYPRLAMDDARRLAPTGVFEWQFFVPDRPDLGEDEDSRLLEKAMSVNKRPRVTPSPLGRSIA